MRTPDGPTVIAVTPVNFDEIIETAKEHDAEKYYTEEKLKEILAEARARNTVAYVGFMGAEYWHKEEPVGKAVHDSGDWRADRYDRN